MQIPFVGASYQERSPSLDAQACINLFPVLGESGTAKAVKALYGTPGRRPLVSAGTGPVRGMHNPTSGTAAIVVIGDRVYRLNTDFTLVPVGFVDTLVTPVSIDDNGLQALIVTGPEGYVLDLVTNVVTRISDFAFYGADRVDFLNTYGILNRPGTNQFYITGANAITFDPLDFATAESNYEPIVNFIVSHEELFFFKASVTEIWRASGALDFPFSRDTNAAIEQGCAAKYSVVTLDNTVFWLGQNTEGGGIVYRMNGYTPMRVSTDAIEFAISKYSSISDAVAYSYQQEGHTFYAINFPSGNATWVYDVATQLWHQRAYLDPNTGDLGRDRSNSHMYFNGKHIVGDYQTGNLYTLDLDYFLDGTAPIPSIRAASHIADGDYSWIVHNRLEIDFQEGVGLSTGQGSAPKALLDWSNDGGRTWSNQHEASIGLIGEYENRAFWTRMGRARDRVYRVTITDPVRRVIVGATLNPKT